MYRGIKTRKGRKSAGEGKNQEVESFSIKEKENRSIKPTYPLIIGILFILAFLFYWYSLRPSNIKKQCALTTVGEHCATSVGWVYLDCRSYEGEKEKKIPASNKEYESCLRKNGL